MASLNIFVDTTHAATLSESDNQFSLVYTEEWKNIGGYSFSPHLDINIVNTGSSVRNFFSNLLPEGALLEGLSKAYQISKYDVFGILKKVGKDCAGALVLLEENEHPYGWGTNTLEHYQKLALPELENRIEESRNHDTPIMFWKVTPRMSLAGVQNKFGVYIDTYGELYLPSGGQPTSHILKPDTDFQHKHKWMAANEYFCMQLARALTLDVPNTSYKNLSTPIYLVQRYDRIWNPDGKLIRSHQIDGCQALNLPPNLKYELEHPSSPLGAKASDILGISQYCKVPALAKRKLLQWLIFNYLIGNTDAHAKNISFLMNKMRFEQDTLFQDRGMEVAPYYDLVCGTVYGYKEMAQSIGGEFEFGLVGKMEWKAFANECGIKFEVLQKIAKDMLKTLDSKLERVVTKVKNETKSAIVDEIYSVMMTHKHYLLESLIGGSLSRS